MGYRVRAGLAAWLAVIAAGCGAGRESGAAEEAPVALNDQDVATVRYAELQNGIELNGSLMPYQVVAVKAQAPGTVQGIRVDRGIRVRKGQVMASIEAHGIRSQAEGARAAVAAAESNLALARQRLASAKTLREAGAMSEIDYQAATAAFSAAEAQLAAAKAQAAGAAEAAAHTTVTAPITGVVSDRRVEDGEAVNPGAALFTVVDATQLELAGQIPVESAAQVRVDQAVTFHLAAHPGEVFRGRVSRIEPVANTDTRQVGVWVRLPNEQHAIIGGQFATGRIVLSSQERALAVPTPAIRGEGSATYVLAVKDGKVERRPVTVGVHDDAAGLVAVQAGLAEGDIVVVTPAAALAEGTRVQIVVPSQPVADTTAERKEG